MSTFLSRYSWQRIPFWGPPHFQRHRAAHDPVPFGKEPATPPRQPVASGPSTFWLACSPDSPCSRCRSPGRVDARMILGWFVFLLNPFKEKMTCWNLKELEVWSGDEEKDSFTPNLSTSCLDLETGSSSQIEWPNFEKPSFFLWDSVRPQPAHQSSSRSQRPRSPEDHAFWPPGRRSHRTVGKGMGQWLILRQSETQ